MRIRTSIRYVALPASAALLVLTGCASSGSGGNGPAATSTPNTSNPLKVIQAAYTTTTAAKTARSMVSLKVDLPGQSATGNGLIMNGLEDFGKQSADETISDVGQGSEIRIIGHDAYLRIPKDSDIEPSVPLPAIHKPWLHIAVPDDAIARSSSLAAIFGSSRPDPTQFVKLLTDVSSSVQRVGSDLIRGQQSAHYRLSFDPSKTGELNKTMDGCDESSSAPKDETPVDVWVDGQGRLTRMQISEKTRLPSASDFAKSLPSDFPRNWPSDLPSGIPSGWPTDLPTDLPSAFPTGLFGTGETITFSITIELYDYGTALNIVPPPAAQTQNVPFSPAMLDDATQSDCPTH